MTYFMRNSVHSSSLTRAQSPNITSSLSIPSSFTSCSSMAICTCQISHTTHLGRVAPMSFMILVQLNLDQKLNRVHDELRCTKLNSDQLIPFGWTAVVIPWTTLIGQATLGLRANYSDVTVTRNAYEADQYRLAVICLNFKLPWSYHTIFALTVAYQSSENTHFVFQ